ncbi:methyltransferase domain-containing protein [Acinetobacter wanghuae]|uniref:Methyltransferase domain-containing protein n=1 Tax=Acinetobacter wanghuae TaxID=2662362 RepID=A0A5Q0NYW4_9GAMM|nr:class I SAM-dependent methyltransferase [Acinetobacter wanghuae]MQW91936.1 methyltransferase domain-containing protein [Acinetobacter wanghuae]QGA10035.1 methyltransferase domain-containing protein [Acinetobacter wanghuae]
MRLFQAWSKQKLQHKYAINAALLGDQTPLPWSNLGYWQTGQHDYRTACIALADHLAQVVGLNSEDKLLDLGCGQGASLLHWQQHYQVRYLAGLELQSHCVSHIQRNLPDLNAIYAASFLRLKDIQFSQKFDVVLCLDAAYHSPLDIFLAQMQSILNSNARIGFHHLMLSERWQTLNSFQKSKYGLLLKSADVNLKNLKTYSEFKTLLEHFEFKNIQIEDLSEHVLAGFSDYVIQHLNLKDRDQSVQAGAFDILKIQMTAKLCRKLYADGLIRYVQVTAQAKY